MFKKKKPDENLFIGVFPASVEYIMAVLFVPQEHSVGIIELRLLVRQNKNAKQMKIRQNGCAPIDGRFLRSFRLLYRALIIFFLRHSSPIVQGAFCFIHGASFPVWRVSALIPASSYRNRWHALYSRSLTMKKNTKKKKPHESFKTAIRNSEWVYCAMQVLRRDGVVKSHITASSTPSKPTLTTVCPTTRVFSLIIINTES